MTSFRPYSIPHRTAGGEGTAPRRTRLVSLSDHVRCLVSYVHRSCNTHAAPIVNGVFRMFYPSLASADQAHPILLSITGYRPTAENTSFGSTARATDALYVMYRNSHIPNICSNPVSIACTVALITSCSVLTAPHRTLPFHFHCCRRPARSGMALHTCMASSVPPIVGCSSPTALVNLQLRTATFYSTHRHD